MKHCQLRIAVAVKIVKPLRELRGFVINLVLYQMSLSLKDVMNGCRFSMIIPRYYQTEAVNAIYHYFMNGGKGNPIIALPTASGKSIIPAIFIEKVLKQWPNQRF